MSNESRRNPKYYNNISVPDTDSRGIELNLQGLNVTPNLNYDHTRLQYTTPVNNTQPVSINMFLNGEERSLHTLILNNSVNTFSKNFIFNPSYVFLDDPVINNTKTVDAGKTAVYYGCIILGKMYLRVSIESTN
jgi:hypothetical protein